MDYPEDLKYTKDHEWLRINGVEADMGITYFAQSELGEVVFADLPAVGRKVAKGEVLCVVESTKAASDVYAPVSGVVLAVNADLSNQPDLINSDPYQAGWMVKLGELNQSEIATLMTASDYTAYVK